MKLKGYLYAMVTITLWSGWIISTRYGMKTDLTPLDLSLMRFVCAGMIMLPIAYKNRHLITKQNRAQVITMSLSSGPAYLLLMAYGYVYAPAVHGILTPCLLPVVVAALSWKMFKEKPNKKAFLGYGFILAGVIFQLISNNGAISDGLFLAGAFFWAMYTVLYKKLGFSAVVATSFVAVISMIFMLIIYVPYQIITPHSVNLESAIFHIIYQGIVTSIISLITFNKAAQILGSSEAAAFGAGIPILVALGSVPILGEYPNTNDIIFVALMTLGVLLASGILAFRHKIK